MEVQGFTGLYGFAVCSDRLQLSKKVVTIFWVSVWFKDILG